MARLSFFILLFFLLVSCTLYAYFLFFFDLLLLRSQKKHTDPTREKLAGCRPASTSAGHSTAQRNQPCTKQRSTYVPIRARQRKQADRVGKSQHVVELLQLDMFSNPANKSKSVEAKKNYDHKKLVMMMREGFALVPNLKTTILHSSLSFVQIDAYDACMRRLGSFAGAWRSWHLQVVCSVCACT